MKKKLTGAALLLLILTLLLGACSESPAAETLSGTPEELMEKLLTGAGLDPEMMFSEAVTGETAGSYLGLSSEDFTGKVESAYASQAAISTRADLVVLVKCKDVETATAVSGLIKDGFDSHRWVCVLPEESFYMTSGSYVLLASTSAENAESLKTAFATLSEGSASEADVFFTHENP